MKSCIEPRKCDKGCLHGFLSLAFTFWSLESLGRIKLGQIKQVHLANLCLWDRRSSPFISWNYLLAFLVFHPTSRSRSKVASSHELQSFDTSKFKFKSIAVFKSFPNECSTFDSSTTFPRTTTTFHYCNFKAKAKKADTISHCGRWSRRWDLYRRGWKWQWEWKCCKEEKEEQVSAKMIEKHHSNLQEDGQGRRSIV